MLAMKYGGHESRFDRRERGDRPPIRVLIVDDDVDSALLVESVFAHLGCSTTCSFSHGEARRLMCSNKADIIILDWMLDRQVDAGKVVAQCETLFNKFDRGRHRNGRPHAQVITYSTLSEREIGPLNTQYFKHVDHWRKSGARRELLERALTLLHRLGR